MSHFNGKVDATFNPPKNWTLNSPLSFKSDRLQPDEIRLLKTCDIDVDDFGTINVPSGYITDLASVPRACWAFIAPWDVARAAIVHDIMYEKINVKYQQVLKSEAKWGPFSKYDRERYREVADRTFLEGMKNADPSVSKWKMYSAYWSVRMFGRWAINNSAPRGE